MIEPVSAGEIESGVTLHSFEGLDFQVQPLTAVVIPKGDQHVWWLKISNP